MIGPGPPSVLEVSTSLFLWGCNKRRICRTLLRVRPSCQFWTTAHTFSVSTRIHGSVGRTSRRGQLGGSKVWGDRGASCEGVVRHCFCRSVGLFVSLRHRLPLFSRNVSGCRHRSSTVRWRYTKTSTATPSLPSALSSYFSPKSLSETHGPSIRPRPRQLRLSDPRDPSTTKGISKRCVSGIHRSGEDSDVSPPLDSGVDSVRRVLSTLA